MRRTNRWTTLLFAIAMILLLVPVVAFGADPGETPNQTLPLPSDMVWSVVAAGLVPLAGYVINHYGPHLDEKVKGLVIAALGIVAAGLTQAILAGQVGFNNVTLQYIVVGLLSAFGAHKLIWKPTGVAVALGAGTNKVGQPVTVPPA